MAQAHARATDDRQAAPETPSQPEEARKRLRGARGLLRELRPAILLTLVLTALLGVVYPLATTGLAQALFPAQANGSIVYQNGHAVGSQLIGEYWTQPQYFHGRPSATVNATGAPSPYNASSSGASNLGPTNKALAQTVSQRITQLKRDNPGVPAGTPIPVDLVTSSGSGLDPDLSVAAAYYQIPRVAKARGLSQAAVRHIVDAHITGRFLGVFGEPVVNVLDVNLALDTATAHT